MGSEILLYGYGLVCLSMLVFNIAYSLYLRSDGRRDTRRQKKLRQLISPQLARLQAGEPLDPKHLTRLLKRLKRVRYLLALDHLLNERKEEPACQAYLGQLQPVLYKLANTYCRREDTQAAYCCSFLVRYARREADKTALQTIVSACLERRSLYCRLNALSALCAFGGAESILDALIRLQQQSDNAPPLHQKVIVETLLTYKGDRQALMRLLLQNLFRLILPFRRAVLDFIRFGNGDFKEEVLAILKDSGQDKELRLSAVRYFGRFPYEPALPELIRFATDLDPTRWEYAAISASSLVRYSGEEVTAALSQAMHSANWHVRYNAARSLSARGFRYEDLQGEAGGTDRYAREMLTYRLETRRQADAGRLPQSVQQGKEDGT